MFMTSKCLAIANVRILFDYSVNYCFKDQRSHSNVLMEALEVFIASKKIISYYGVIYFKISAPIYK